METKVGSAPHPPVVPVAAEAGPATANPPPSSSVECCMCGDHGLARELFRCKACHFRYQHKYCSDLYPKVDSYRSCNWCLRENGTTTPAAAAAPNSVKASGKHNHNQHHSSAATPSSSHLSPLSSNKDQHHDYRHHKTPSSTTAAQTSHKLHNNNNSHSLSSSTSTADNNSTGSSVAGAPTVKKLHRGVDIAAHLLAKPLKKLRPAVLQRSASEVIVRVRAAEEMGAPPPINLAGGRHAAGGAPGGGVRGKIRRYKLLEEVSS